VNNIVNPGDPVPGIGALNVIKDAVNNSFSSLNQLNALPSALFTNGFADHSFETYIDNQYIGPRNLK
jgi:hypothetical protein